MATVIISQIDRHDFEYRLNEFYQRKNRLRSITPGGFTLKANIWPPMSGPDHRGLLTYLDVPDEFTAELRAAGFKME